MPNLIGNGIFYDTDEFAGLLGVGRDMFYLRMRREGVRPEMKISGKNFYSADTVRAVMRTLIERKTKKRAK
jgi:hypothetical protein